MDERRRRRLAVDGNSAGADSSDLGAEKLLPDNIPAELCAASPWIPRSLWKLWTLTCLLISGLVAVGAMVFYTPTFRPELAPALDPLFRGEQPKLVTYLETIFWTLSGQLALLVGWHRACSRLDFRGRYRVWPWAAAAMFGCGLCVATNLHVGLGSVIDQLGLLQNYLPRIGWMLPALCLMLPLGILMDRDVRRSWASIILLRTTLMVLFAGIVVELSTPSWIDKAVMPIIELVCGLGGSALLMLAMWVQGWHVAYVTPDPPVAPPYRWPRLSFGIFRIFGIFGWMIGLVFGLFRRRASAAATPRRRKKAEETGTTKRKRKTKKPARRSRAKVVEEEEAEEGEDVAEEEAEESEEYDEESAEAEEESYEEEEESPRGRVTAPAAGKSYSQHAPSRSDQVVPKPHANFAASNQQSHDDEDDESDDGESGRGDGPPAEQLKGLSKRQRRALIKQYRDQQRSQRR